MSDKPEPAKDAPAPPPSASKLPLVGMALSLLNIGATGFVALKVIKMPHAPAAIAAAGEHGEHGEAGEHGAAKPKPVATMEPFVVNLNEPGSSRYLKTSFELELENDKTATELTTQKRAVRDEMLRYLSNLAVADTLGEESKTKIQGQLIARAEKLLGAKSVRHLFFTEFVVQ